MADNLRGGGPFALCSLHSAAVEIHANLDPALGAYQRPILARHLTLDAAKMETNNNHNEEGLKQPIGDVEKSMEFDKRSEDDSDDEEVWESVSELASDEEYVTDDGEEEEEGGLGEFEEDEEEDDDDDEDEDEEEDDDEEDDDDQEEEEVEEGNGMDDGTVSSGDEGGEKCAICLCSFNNQEVGSPESCDHTFCFECIYEWSKNVTTCPVDRSVFTLILVRNTFHGEIVRQMEVKAQEALDEDQDPTYCEVCGECDREDRLLLCDECDAGYHCECLTPPLVHIPIEEWYCPNCATPDHEDESSEEEYISNLRRPVRRVREHARAIARTQVAERVLSRVRQARELRRIDEQEQTGAASTSAPRVPKARRKTVRKRKTTKRKTTKRKRNTTKRKTTTRKKRKSTTTTTASGTKKKRRKTRRKKRKVRRTSVGARTARPSVAKTIRRRIAGKLNLVKPKVGSMMPDIKQKGEHSLLLKRHEIGVASLSLTGSEHLFDPSGYDESPVTRGPGAQSAPTPARLSTSSASTSSGPLDLLGSIMQGQNILHMKSENITIHKDGTLSSAKKKPDEKSTAKRSPKKTAHRSSTSSTTSHKYNSEKESSKPVTDVTSQHRRSSEGHAQGHGQGQKTSDTWRSGMQSLSGEASQNIHHGIKDDDLEPVLMDIDDDDDDDRDLNFMSKGKESFIGSSVGRMQQSHGTNSHSESLRTKADCQVDEPCLQNIPLQPNEGQESQGMDDNGNDESDGDVGYHGNSDDQEGDGGYEQDGGEEDQGDQEENPINNNNNNDGEEDGGDGDDGDEGEDGDGDEGEGGDDEEEEEEAEEEEAEEEEAEGEEAEAEDAPLDAEEDQELYADLEYTDKKNDGQTEEEDRPAREVAEEEVNIKNAAPDDGVVSQQIEDAGSQDDGCEDENEKGEESEEEQLAEEQEEEEGDVEEEQEVDEEEEEVEEEVEEEKQGEEEEQHNEELKNNVDQEETEEGNAGEDEGEEAEKVEEQKGDDEEEDGEAEEIGDGQEESTVTAEKSSDRTSSRPLIGELECEDISDEDNVPEDDGQQGSESDEEGMIIETSDGRVIEAKPKAKDSRKEQRTEPVESHQTPVEETESAVKHGASSAEEGEVKTDDESKKGKKARGKRKRKKRNRDKRNVVVDPRKSISLHPQLPADRLPTRGDEPSGRREGSREAFGDLRQVIQVKRDTPYTAEELRRYHEECWEEYNRRRDERRVERVGAAWDQYTYDQYAYYEAWRSMGGEFATGRPWGLHVQRDRSPIYDRRKNGEPQAFDPRLETQRQSARKDNERGKEEGSRKSSEKKTKSESDKGRKDQPTKKESSRSQKDDKDKVKKEKTKSKGHIHENSARDKNGRERDGGEKDKKSRDKEKEKEKDRVSRNKHGHDRDKDQSRQKERERSRERDRSRKDREHRSRERDKHRSRDRERSRDRGRDKHHKRGSEREHSRSKEDHGRSRHRSRSRDRERSRKRDRSSESDRVSSKDRRRDRSRDRGRDRSREKAAHRDHDKSKDRERTREIVKKTEERKSISSVKVPQRKERGKVTVDASGVRKILLGEKAKPKEPKKVVEKPIPVTAKVEKVKVKKVKKEKTGAEGKVEKKGKKTKLKGEKKVTKGKKKKVVSKRPLSFDVDEISTPTKKKKAPAPVEQAQKAEDIVLKPPSPLKFDDDDADDMMPVPSTTRSGSCSPDLYIDIAAPDSDLSRTVTEPSKPLPKPKSPADVAVADSSHLETDMYDPFNPTASPPSGIKSPSPIVSEASPLHDTATSSSVEVFKRAATPPPEVPPNPTSTTDVSSSDMATNPPQQGMTNEDRLMLASQASQQITKILNQLATVPVAKPRVSPESPIEQTMSSASIELGLSPEHVGGSSISVSSLGSEKNYKVDPIIPQDNIGDVQEDDIEMSAVDLYNKNSRDRYLKKLYHQERVVEEVKLAIKPHYQRKVINKEDYKEILRKSVNQVCHSKTGEINPVKIRRLIDGYVKKVQHKNKKPGDKLGKLSGGSAGKTTFKSSSKGSSKSSSKSGSKTTREPASASKLIEKGRSLGLKSK
ncbi:PHD and RING finger domain-containing protein 1-like [Lytechinus variegatus]|uniref:PHD and RING finger domain-containing protein 1-like n=1 Tax=Lytechinus variegatus TaxID=7654 RepID=UPI001BB2A6E3|nr:PHD and RING finger domain-containing protein 1-like [Lytechinus variegatus]